MRGIKIIFNNINKYFNYAKYASKSELKAEVANSYLNWIWWVLDPLCFMIIYTFIVVVVFKSNESYLPVFVFIGITLWNFFSKLLSASVKIISSNKAIVSKVYIPKYILLISKSFTLLFKTMISFALIIVLMIIFKVPFTLNMLYFILVLIPFYLVTFGFSTFLMHFGVYIEDLSPTTNILLKLLFYMSGIFYNIELRIPFPYNQFMLYLNPIAYLISEFRNVLIYNVSPNFIFLTLWGLIGLILSLIGMLTISKYENSYVKVI